MEWISLAFSAIAIVISVVAAHHAHRSASAAEDTAVSSRRSADAGQRQIALEEERAARYETPWTVERELGTKGNGRFRLHNQGDEPCHDVEIAGDVHLPFFEQGSTVGGRESVVVIDVRSMGGEPEPLSVTWRRPPEAGGERYGPWRYTL